ncbi:NAD-binding protein [Streptacidiphilus monticola]
MERTLPLLLCYAAPDRVVRTGGPGTGYTVKLLVNQLWFGQAVATAEALLLGSRLGVAPELLRAALADGAASSAFVRDDLDALFAGDYLPCYGLDRIHQQLSALTALARAHGLPHAVAAAVADVHAEALGAFGPIDGELAAVALMERQAGFLIRPGADLSDTPARPPRSTSSPTSGSA